MKKGNRDSVTEASKHTIAKRRKRFERKRPARKPAKSLSVLVAEALGNKLNQIANEASGRTYGEMIAEKLVNDALSGKLPAQVVSKLFEASDAKQELRASSPLSERNTEELKYFVRHGRWPEDSSSEFLVPGSQTKTKKQFTAEARRRREQQAQAE